ncbi:MAG: histidine phosphatase family protein [Acidimicrobiales bacterium]
MPSLLLLRHAASTWNLAGRWQGHANPPLSDLGESAARAAADWLPSRAEFARVVSSDLERAHRTATIVAGALGITEVCVDPRLRERDVGEWSGLTTDEIERRWPGAVKAWRQGLLLEGPPGGEDDDALRSRALEALGQLLDDHGHEGPMLVVTHGGLIRVVELACGAPPSRPANLRGRWVERDHRGAGWRAGAVVKPLDPRPAEASR